MRVSLNLLPCPFSLPLSLSLSLSLSLCENRLWLAPIPRKEVWRGMRLVAAVVNLLNVLQRGSSR